MEIGILILIVPRAYCASPHASCRITNIASSRILQKKMGAEIDSAPAHLYKLSGKRIAQKLLYQYFLHGTGVSVADLNKVHT